MQTPTTTQNTHITEHDYNNEIFIREINHPDDGHRFMVLDVESGEFVGHISDGSDCTFATLAEAQAYAATVEL